MWNCGTFLLSFLQKNKNLQNFSNWGVRGDWKIEIWEADGYILNIKSTLRYNYRFGVNAFCYNLEQFRILFCSKFVHPKTKRL